MPGPTDYLLGHEGFLKLGYETPIGIDEAINALPAVSLLGPANAPDIELRENPVPWEGGGHDEDFANIPQLKEQSASGSMIFAGGAESKKALRAILSKDASSGIPAGSHVAGVPSIAMVGAAANPHDPLRGLQWAGRQGFFSMLELAIQRGELARFNYEAQFMTVVQSGVPTAPTRTQILTAAGAPFSLHNVSVLYNDGTADINLRSQGLESISWRATREVTRHGIRSAPGTVLDRCPQSLRAGKIRHEINLGLLNPISVIPAAIVYEFANGTNTIAVELTNLATNTYGMKGQGSAFGFPLSLLATTATVS